MSDNRWKFEKLKQGLASEAPSLCITSRESIRVGQELGERKHCVLAIEGSCKFLSVLENDTKVNLGEETVIWLVPGLQK